MILFLYFSGCIVVVSFRFQQCYLNWFLFNEMEHWFNAWAAGKLMSINVSWVIIFDSWNAINAYGHYSLLVYIIVQKNQTKTVLYIECPIHTIFLSLLFCLNIIWFLLPFLLFYIIYFSVERNVGDCELLRFIDHPFLIKYNCKFSTIV